MNRFSFSLIFLIMSFVSLAAEKSSFSKEFQSPNRAVTFKVFQHEGITYYKVYYHGSVVIDQSPLGIETSAGSFYRDLNLTENIRSRMVINQYTLPIGKTSLVKNRCQEVTLHLTDPQSHRMDIIFRVSDDGVAYRYKLYGKGDCTVYREYSAFQLPSEATGFMTPLSKAKSGWARTNPSYEEHYVYDVPVGTPSSLGQGWTFPVLFRIPRAGWVMLSETGTDGRYCGTHLSESADGGLYKIEFPHEEEGLPTQSAYATMALPYETPWRMMIVGTSPGKVAESTMATDLVEPLYKPKFEYKPGKATWSWLVLKDDSITYDISRRFIDMADRLNFTYCLIDAPWDVQIGREKIEKLSGYALSKGVGLLLWYNSNGLWNDAPQTPKNLMNDRAVRRHEMEWMQKIGVKGIKVDFFGGDKQFFMQYYQDILTDANDFGLTVNFHGTTLPRGWEKMYPNFVTDESVKGMEFITFEQVNADRQPQHCATLPFLRNAVAPMDFTPLILNQRLGVNPQSGPVRRTTAAFELALPVVLFSGVQHFGLVPENLNQFPAFVFDYLRAVPTVWDETRFLGGYPGKDCMVARRTGKIWYIAGINGEKEEKNMTIPLSGLVRSNAKGRLIVDKAGESNQVEMREIKTPEKNKNLNLKIQGNGGFIMIFEGDNISF